MSGMSQRDMTVGATDCKRTFHRRHGCKRNHIKRERRTEMGVNQRLAETAK